ncbi:spore coat protein [Alicyclobacillus suci]|uniref:spore coat protein n=1 Tax=Alicyclobacillus suci TaxID=2816080 RepID=UPI001A906BA2|nr:spore coat protein [Alicyclobacillus suci]
MANMDTNMDTKKVDLDIERFSNLIPLANQSAALECLLTIKSGVRNYAIALTECATPEVRTTVRNQLNALLDMHEKLSELMIRKGWLQPHNPAQQFQMDIQTAQITQSICKLPLFRDRTPILETFDTPQH